MEAGKLTVRLHLGFLAVLVGFCFAAGDPEKTETPEDKEISTKSLTESLTSSNFLQQPGRELHQQVRSSDPGKFPPRPIPDEQILMERLLDNYHKYSRPVINASLSVVVKFGLTLVQISDMEWIDERLTWDPKDYNNLQILRIPCEKLWLPDIVLYNRHGGTERFVPSDKDGGRSHHCLLKSEHVNESGADDYTTGYMNSKAMVHSNGNVFWPPPAKFRSSCKIDITYFPFDDQTCELKFGSWTYDGFQVNITNRSSTVDLQNYVFSGEWELIDVRIRRTEMTYACCIEPYPDVRFTIVIRRKTLYYLFNIIFPCLWLTILSLLGFWLPPDSGEKITLGITVLLAFSVFMLLIAESMPATSEFVPLIGIYLTVTMGMTSLSIILTVFVLQLHHVGPHKRRVPRWLRSLVFGIFARLVCMCHDSQTFRCNDHPRTAGADPHTFTLLEPSSGTTEDDHRGRCGGASLAAPAGNTSGRSRTSPSCNGDALLQRNNGSSDRQMSRDNEVSTATLSVDGDRPRDYSVTQATRYEVPVYSSGFKNSFRSSFRRDRRFRGSFREGCPVPSDYAMEMGGQMYQRDPEFSRYQELVAEWQFVAHVMDRVLFWLFLFVAVVSSLAILVIKPLFKPAAI